MYHETGARVVLTLQDPGGGLSPVLTGVSKLKLKAPSAASPVVSAEGRSLHRCMGTRLSSRDRSGQLDQNRHNPERSREKQKKCGLDGSPVEKQSGGQVSCGFHVVGSTRGCGCGRLKQANNEQEGKYIASRDNKLKATRRTIQRTKKTAEKKKTRRG